MLNRNYVCNVKVEDLLRKHRNQAVYAPPSEACDIISPEEEELNKGFDPDNPMKTTWRETLKKKFELAIYKWKNRNKTRRTSAYGKRIQKAVAELKPKGKT